MLAVIKTGGKQYVIQPKDKIKIEKIDTPEGGEVTFSEVLLVSDEKELKVGSPLLKGVSVKGKVLEQGKGKKVTLIKHKAKKRYLKKQGHRQSYTLVEIAEISKA